jgi:DNA-binding winged helix-turn-helix (wHTH) protein/Flp pilus assembly protein TadD
MSEPVFPAQPATVCYQIGEHFLLNTHTNRLTRGEEVIELEDRLVLLLVYFIEHAGEVLHKDVLLNAIWHGKVVNEDSVAVAVSYLRKALGDSSRTPTFIKTIQGKGYQFIGKAEPLTNNSLPVSDTPTASKKYLFLSAVIASLVLVLAYGIKTFTSNSSPEKASESSEWKKDFQAANTLLAQSDADSLRSAIKQFRQILSVHGESAQVYLGIADAKTRLLNEKVTLKENCVEIIDLTEKALSLQPTLAAAHTTAANMAFWCRRDTVYAEQYYLEAIKLNPKDDSALMNYAQLLLALKRFDESLANVEQARRLNPTNYSVPNVVWIYQMQGRDDLAERELNRILTTEPEDRYYHISAKRIYERMGNADKAFEQWLWLMRAAGFSADNLEQVQQLFKTGGLAAVNQWLVTQKITAELGDYSPPLAWGRYALVAKDYDAALGFLEAAFEQRQPALLWANVDPAYDPVRNRLRFQQLLARMAQVENY